jgi:alkylation response protein AidB-like acyl-CoA dehydrogenase
VIGINLGPVADTLKNDFLSWLNSNKPPALPANCGLEEFVEISRKWQRRLAAEHWVGVHWPQEYGGRGLSIVEEAVIQECLAAAGSPQLVNLFGLTMVGPVLIKHGTKEHKERFLSKILSADEIWCQGFSEPEAGSDLASLRTSATRLEDANNFKWQIVGQKVWTSFAQFANWCFMLVRTDNSVAKHRGLSYFLVPMNSEGLTISPLKQITGDAEFNELFLDKVKVDNDLMVGNPGDGWKIAISTLMHERVVLTYARHLQSEQALFAIKSAINSLGELNIYAEDFGRLAAKNMAVRLLALSHLLTYTEDNSPGPEGSLDKLTWSETFQDIAKLAMKLQGARAIEKHNANRAIDNIETQHRYLYSRGRTVAAGTSEIQRNIVAERILELPKT